jgi:hypothetical protein
MRYARICPRYVYPSLQLIKIWQLTFSSDNELPFIGLVVIWNQASTHFCLPLIAARLYLQQQNLGPRYSTQLKHEFVPRGKTFRPREE